MRKFLRGCVEFAALMFLLWLRQIMDAFSARKYLRLLFCLAVPGIHVVWLSGITLIMFGPLSALAMVPFAGVGGLAVVNTVVEDGKSPLL